MGNRSWRLNPWEIGTEVRDSEMVRGGSVNFRQALLKNTVKDSEAEWSGEEVDVPLDSGIQVLRFSKQEKKKLIWKPWVRALII